jgi:hypothetical protein
MLSQIRHKSENIPDPSSATAGYGYGVKIRESACRAGTEAD